jgi:uncharacterized membrane protein
VVWLRVAVLIYVIAFPYTPIALKDIVNAVFFSGEGYAFLAVGTAFGAVFASLVFMGSVVSLPMMLDRRASLLKGLVVSFVAVVRNIRAMALWAAVIVVVTGAGLLTAYVGLAVALPLIGHASWHAYRAVVRREE